MIRDSNNAWYEGCRKWLQLGLEILDDAHVVPDHRSSRDAVSEYLKRHDSDPTVAGILIVDAVAIHDTEIARIDRTLL